MSKINLFEDKEFDKLDWLNRAVEPFIFPPNDVLVHMPEEYVFDLETILSIMSRGTLSVDLSALVEYVAKRSGVELGSYHMCIKEQYQLLVSPDAQLNFEKREMIGTIRIVKLKNQLTDEDIQALLALKINEKLRGIYANDPLQIPRLNEVLDLIGGHKEARSSRSGRHKVSAIAEGMTAVVKEDKWRVRNYDLMLKCADWIKDYVDKGNLASMSNFTRLKCMTHKGQPIYSMEETV